MKVKINLTNQTLEYLDSMPYIQGTDTRNKLIVYVPNEVTNIAISYQLQNGRNTIKMSNSGVVAADSDDYLSGYWGYIFVAPKALTSLSGNFMASVIVTISTNIYKINVMNTVLNSVDFEAFETALEEYESEILESLDAMNVAIGNKADRSNAEQTIVADTIKFNTWVGGINANLKGITNLETYEEGDREIILEYDNGFQIIYNNTDGFTIENTTSGVNSHIFFDNDGHIELIEGVEQNTVLLDGNGFYFNDKKILDESDVVDNLTSTNEYKPLSANQGKVLKDYVDATFVPFINSSNVTIKAPAFKILYQPDNSKYPLLYTDENSLYISRANKTNPTIYEAGTSLQLLHVDDKTSGMYIDSVSGIDVFYGSSNGFSFKNSKFTIPSSFDYYKGTQKIATEDYVGTQITTLDNDLQSQIDAINAGQNLADIVADLTALNNLDTTKLQSGDKVQVLVDSDHDNASTVYNWNGSAWVYIGKYGQDSYTKAESDNKFVPKTAIKQVSSNSTTDVPSLALFKTVEDRINVGYLNFSNSDFTRDGLSYRYTRTLTTEELAEINKGLCVIEFKNFGIPDIAWGENTKVDGSVVFRNGTQQAIGTVKVQSSNSDSVLECYCAFQRINPNGNEVALWFFIKSTYSKYTLDTLFANMSQVIDIDAEDFAVDYTLSSSDYAKLSYRNTIIRVNDNDNVDIYRAILEVDDDGDILLQKFTNGKQEVIFRDDTIHLIQPIVSGSTSIDTAINSDGDLTVSVKDSYVESFFATDAEVATMLSEVFA